MIHKYAHEIKVDTNITPHMFRHSFATYLMEEDVNIRYIQKNVGAYIDNDNTDIYICDNEKRKRNFENKTSKK